MMLSMCEFLFNFQSDRMQNCAIKNFVDYTPSFRSEPEPPAGEEARDGCYDQFFYADVNLRLSNVLPTQI